MLCAIPIHGELIRTAAQAIELRSVPRWYRPYAVQDAFQAGRKAEWLKDRAVVVVDDVMTTGSTVREVARVMCVNGADRIGLFLLFGNDVRTGIALLHRMLFFVFR